MGRRRPGVLAVVVVAVLAAVLASARGPDDDVLAPLPWPVVDAADEELGGTDGYRWGRVPIGAGGFVTGLALVADGDSSRAYARTDVGGAYRWDAEAASWRQMLSATTLGDAGIRADDYSVASIAVHPADPDLVVLAVGWDDDPDAPGEGRVLLSRDGGRSWTSSEQRWWIHGNQAHRTGSERIAFDPSDPSRIWFGTQREGLWVTDDGGASWTQVADVPAVDEGGEDPAGVSAVAVVAAPEGSVVVAGAAHDAIHVGSGGGWRRIVELERGQIPSSPTVVGDDVLMAIDRPDAGDGGRLVRIADVAGAARVADLPLPTGAARWMVAVDPGDPSRMVLADEAVRDGRLWTTTDAGSTWVAHDVDIRAQDVPWLARTNLTEWMTAGRLVIDPVDRDLVWFAEGMGVWTARLPVDHEVEWESRSRGIELTVVSDIVVPRPGVPIVTIADRQGFVVEDLERYPSAPLFDDTFLSGTAADVSGRDPSVVAWLGLDSSAEPSVVRARGAVSADGGRSWREMGDLGPGVAGGEIAVSAMDPDTMVLVPTHRLHPAHHLDVQMGVRVSHDGGRRWGRVDPDPDPDADSFHRFAWWFTRRSLAADQVDGRFYLMSDVGRFYASDDGGVSWVRASHAPPCTVEVDCHVVGQLHAEPKRAGALWASTGRGGLHRSDDAGATAWTRVPGIVEARAMGFGAPLAPEGPATVFVHGRREGDERRAIWRSSDRGATWDLVAVAPGGVGSEVMALSGDPWIPGRVYVGFHGVGAIYGDPSPAGPTGSP